MHTLTQSQELTKIFVYIKNLILSFSKNKYKLIQTPRNICQIYLTNN